MDRILDLAQVFSAGLAFHNLLRDLLVREDALAGKSDEAVHCQIVKIGHCQSG